MLPGLFSFENYLIFWSSYNTSHWKIKWLECRHEFFSRRRRRSLSAMIYEIKVGILSSVANEKLTIQLFNLSFFFDIIQDCQLLEFCNVKDVPTILE